MSRAQPATLRGGRGAVSAVGNPRRRRRAALQEPTRADSLAALGCVTRHRAPLVHTRAALARGELTVGFLGGSITAPHTGTRWPEPLAAWLVESNPGVRVTIANAALGATGSDLAVFRVQSEIIARGCDLVFVEYAVNDFDQPTGRRNRTREGLLRQLAAAPCDVVLVHTFRAEMRSDMEAGRVPASIAEFEVLAAHYGLTSVWMGLQALREVRTGLMTMADWLPDGLHPEQRGSLSYAQSVIAAVAREFAAGDPVPAPHHREALPAALTAGAWEHVGFVPFSDVVLRGPWTAGPGMKQALRSTVPGAGLQFEFAGRGLVLGFDFGRTSGEVRYRLDEGEWHETRRDRPGWVGDHGWFRPEVVADDLPPGRHGFELETTDSVAAGVRSADTTLGFLGVIR